jgi:hypothetical protein
VRRLETRLRFGDVTHAERFDLAVLETDLRAGGCPRPISLTALDSRDKDVAVYTLPTQKHLPGGVRIERQVLYLNFGIMQVVLAGATRSAFPWQRSMSRTPTDELITRVTAQHSTARANGVTLEF